MATSSQLGNRPTLHSSVNILPQITLIYTDCYGANDSYIDYTESTEADALANVLPQITADYYACNDVNPISVNQCNLWEIF